MKKRSRGLRQLEIVLPTWGGAREGAGRKRSGPRARVRHRTRPVRAGRLPVIVTIRLRPEWRGLREPALVQPLRDLIAAVNARGRLRIVEYCFLDDHLHMLVEAADRTALAHGLQGFSTSARRVDALRRDG